MITNLELAHAETRYDDSNEDSMIIKINLSGLGKINGVWPVPITLVIVQL